MKKIIKVLLCLLIITSFAGCSSEKDSTTTTATATETTTTATETATTVTETTATATETTATNAADETSRKLTNVEKDGYIIYDLSYKEARILSGTSSDSINIKTEDTKTTYTYIDHVLSCGTFMNGTLVEEVNDTIKTIIGSFDVTKNPYEITELKVNISIDTATGKKTGFINVNGEEIDINSKFGPITN